MLRRHVVGRKTWYGTHSERGARTSAILFSVVETCKLNQVNPGEYFPWVVEAIKGRKAILTPAEFKQMETAPQGPSGAVGPVHTTDQWQF